MGTLDLDLLDATPLVRDPFEFVIVPDFIAPGSRGAIERDLDRKSTRLNSSH